MTRTRMTLTLGYTIAADPLVFLLSAGKLQEAETDLIFYNNGRSADGGVTLQDDRTFEVDLSLVAPRYDQIVITLTAERGPLRASRELSIRETGGDLNFDALPHLNEQTSVMLLRFYRRDGGWRVEAVGQGFNGGLAALVKHFGGQVRDEEASPPPAAPPAPPPAAPAVSLKKQQQAVNLRKAQQHAPELVPIIEQARVSLEKRGLDDSTFCVNLILDISGSMSEEYRSGAVQELANRALGLAARLDDDGAVNVYLFGHTAHRKGSMTIENARNFVKNMRVRLEGGTEYAPVMEMVWEDARRQTRYPHLNLFITDGGTSNASRVVRLMREMSGEPMFWKFMGIEQGGWGSTSFDFLEKLDDLTGRTLDNADFFKVRTPLRSTPDSQLFDLLVQELDTWQRDARRAGILR